MCEVECICTCARAHLVFQISQTAGRIAFKFGVCLGTHQRRALHKSDVGSRLRTCTPLSHDGEYSLTRPIRFKFGGSLPKPGHDGSFSGLGDGQPGRSSETAELTGTRIQHD